MPSLAKIHVCYIIGILVAIIVALVTIKWAEIPALVNYLNFALGVASLILAILAIVYAFVSNGSVTSLVAKIDVASSTVGEQTLKLEKAVEGLDAHLRLIPAALKSVEGKVAETHALLKASGQQSQAVVSPADSKENAALIHKLVEQFASISSWNGLKVVYLCILAFEKGKSFDLKLWAEGDAACSFDYAYGFLVASSSAALLNHKAEGTRISVISVIPHLAERIRHEVKVRTGDAAGLEKSERLKQITVVEKFVENGG